MSSLNVSAPLCFAILTIIAKTDLMVDACEVYFCGTLRWHIRRVWSRHGFRYRFGLRYQWDLISQDISISVHRASDWLIWVRQ